MRKKPTSYFTMESAMTATSRDSSGKMHYGILFDRRLPLLNGNTRMDRMEDALAVACIAVVLFVAAWLFVEFFSLWNGSQTQLPKDVRAFSKIPGPRGLPWFGSVIQHIMNAKSIQHACIKKKLFEQYGPIFKETVMGKTHVYIQSPADLEAVFKAEGKFPKRSTDVMLTLKEYFRTRNVMEAPILDLL